MQATITGVANIVVDPNASPPDSDTVSAGFATSGLSDTHTSYYLSNSLYSDFNAWLDTSITPGTFTSPFDIVVLVQPNLDQGEVFNAATVALDVKKPTVYMQRSFPQMSERDAQGQLGYVDITFYRTNEGLDQPLPFHAQTSGTASLSDYTGSLSVLTFDANSNTKTVRLTASDNDVWAEPAEETLVVKLTSGAYYQVPDDLALSEETIKIKEDDFFQFP